MRIERSSDRSHHTPVQQHRELTAVRTEESAVTCFFLSADSAPRRTASARGEPESDGTEQESLLTAQVLLPLLRLRMPWLRENQLDS